MNIKHFTASKIAVVKTSNVAAMANTVYGLTVFGAAAEAVTIANAIRVQRRERKDEIDALKEQNKHDRAQARDEYRDARKCYRKARAEAARGEIRKVDPQMQATLNRQREDYRENLKQVKVTYNRGPVRRAKVLLKRTGRFVSHTFAVAIAAGICMVNDLLVTSLAVSLHATKLVIKVVSRLDGVNRSENLSSMESLLATLRSTSDGLKSAYTGLIYDEVFPSTASYQAVKLATGSSPMA